MVKIIYKSHSGEERAIDATVGRNLMETAVAAGIPGIDGDCGGVCACATCHVYVGDAWLALVGERGAMEGEMLDMLDGLRPSSRLACQIQVSPALEGLTVQTPESQGY